jgi:hypothetical protein
MSPQEKAGENHNIKYVTNPLKVQIFQIIGNKCKKSKISDLPECETRLSHLGT